MQATRWIMWLSFTLILLVPMSSPISAQFYPDDWSHWDLCGAGVFSVEEDFVPVSMAPCGEEPYVSDGDLIAIDRMGVCLRNVALLRSFAPSDEYILETGLDLGLDAVDVLSLEYRLVAFSTEIDSPDGQFSNGALLITGDPEGPLGSIRIVIPNAAFLWPIVSANPLFASVPDVGLDAVHFLGDEGRFVEFVERANGLKPEDWLDGVLQEALGEELNIWFSVEGTWPSPLFLNRVTSKDPSERSFFILDGDVISARDGFIVRTQAELFHPHSYADVRDRGPSQEGLDFGLDALSGPRDPEAFEAILFSTELSYSDTFQDGDVLETGGNVVYSNTDLLVTLLEGYSAGLDALWIP